MSNKSYVIDDIEVKVFKRKNSKNIKLSINSKGYVSVSIPYWSPYAVGFQFAKSKITWIKQNIRPANSFNNFQRIGKLHTLDIRRHDNISVKTRLTDTTVIVHIPKDESEENPDIQNKIEKACIRALRHQAELLLPSRLQALAATHNISYNSVSIKHLKRRWGSCDVNQNIVLNLYLMVLPWELIDYVLLHELTHTKIMQHGSIFWDEMSKLTPNLKDLKKGIRNYQPILNNA